MPAARSILVAVAFIAAYLALDWLSYIHPMQRYSITPWNPQPALAIALLMIAGQHWIGVVFAAVVAAEWAIRGAPSGWPSTAVIGAVLALGYAAIARALTGRFSVGLALETRRDAGRLVGVVAVGALGTGILYVAALLASGIGPLDEPFIALIRFWIGDTVGILVTLPFVLMLSVHRRRAEMAGMLRQRETAIHVGAIALALAVVLARPGDEQVKLFYVLFLPLIWTATRHGLAGAILAVLAIQGTIVAAGELAGYQTLTVFELQALLIALTVTGVFLGVTVDERRRAEADLRRSLRLAAAGEMAAALAHELNQPLTAVASYARASQLLVDSPATDRDALHSTMVKLVGEATRAAEVVRRLRDFFRAGTLRLAPFQVAEAARRVISSLAAAAEAKGVRVELRAGASLPPLTADETQLEVVLRNLIMNGIEAASGKGGMRVDVEIDAVGDDVRVSVTDSGTGVAAADADRIFEPFETTRASGMGMGLAISRAIVEAHGGRLWAEPAQRGVFRFVLPSREP